MASVIGAGPWGTGDGRKKRDRRGPGVKRTGGAAGRLADTEQIARLLVSYDNHAGGMPGQPARISDLEVAAFAPLAVALEAHELLAEVESYLAQGLSAERIFVELLAPAARHLGSEWTADRLDFIDVTMGLWRLQEVLREVAARAGPGAPPCADRRVLFSPLPGEQHSFGAAMIDECFSRAGWNSDLLIEPTRALLLARVAATDYDLVGLTVSCNCHIGELSSLIVAVRNVSKNSEVRLMLGGRVLVEDPDLARRAGADGTAANATDALDLAERLLTVAPRVVYA